MEKYNDEKLVITAEDRENYGKAISYGRNIKVSCYSKKQIKSIYPKNNYRIKGECAVKENIKHEAKGVFRYGDKDFPLYRINTHSRLIYKVKGYVACGDTSNHFVAFLKNMLYVYLLILVMGIGMIFGGYQFYTHYSKPAANTLSLDPNSVDWKGNLPEPKSGGVTEGIRIPGYKSITIAANKTDVKVNLVNPEQNKCYFVISLILADKNEVLYKSKMVEPGKGFYDITLTHALKPGTYAAKVKYDTFSMDKNLSPLNGAVVNIDLIAG